MSGTVVRPINGRQIQSQTLHRSAGRQLQHGTGRDKARSQAQSLDVYVFPQNAGLGTSPTASFSAISSIAEAKAYFVLPVLGQRLRACVEVFQYLTATTAESVFGSVDAMKLRCSTVLS